MRGHNRNDRCNKFSDQPDEFVERFDAFVLSGGGHLQRRAKRCDFRNECVGCDLLHDRRKHAFGFFDSVSGPPQYFGNDDPAGDRGGNPANERREFGIVHHRYERLDALSATDADVLAGTRHL